MTKQLPIFLRSLLKSSLQVAICVGVISTIAARSAQAGPINCSSIYINVKGSTQIYSVNTSTAVATPTATLPLNSATGIAVLGGATPTLYSDSYTTDTSIEPNILNYTDGTTTGSGINSNVTFDETYLGGLGADASGHLFYISNTSDDQVIYRFDTTTSVVTPYATITSTDPIWASLQPGDMMSDGNGRLYYFGVANFNAAQITNYLFYVDSSNIAHRLGSYESASPGIGVAFDSAGNVYTTDNSGDLYKISLTNGFSYNFVGHTGVNSIDMGSCALPIMNPSFNAADAVSTQVRNVTTNQALATQDIASPGDILEYQITIENSGSLPSDSTKFAGSIPAGTTYVAGSTKMYDSTGTTTVNPVTPVADLTGGAAPFTAPATGTTPATSAGMLVNTPGQFAGIVTTGGGNAVVVKFQVKVDANATGIIPNSATLTYPVANSGVFTKASQISNSVNTTLSVNVSGSVWNDLDLSGKGGTIFTTGESGTNANSSSFYAYLVDATNQTIASSPISATGKYSFPNVLPNQTGLKIELSTTAPPSPLPSPTVPAPSLPTGWKSTSPLTISSINTLLAHIPNQDFGIVQGANVVLVKRITGIMPAGTSTWVRTINPNDNVTPLNTVVHNTPNDATTINWPTTPAYLVGAVNAGLIQPGDRLEYTIYYLNTQGAPASSLKICDPIRGNQTYNSGSMQLLPGGATTAIALTDAVDGFDRANTYGTASTTGTPIPIDCNATNSTASGTDSGGGVAVQIVGTGATVQPNPSSIFSAIAAGTPTSSYGLFRFTTTVKP